MIPLIALLGGLALLFYVRTSSADTPLTPFKGVPTAAMGAWSASILNGPLPMGSTVTKDFDGRKVIARVEKHTWTYRNGVKVAGNFRGVTLYEG